MTPATTLAQVLAESATWQLAPITDVQAMIGGNSNHSYQLTAGEERCVLRINRAEAEQLGANRDWERLALAAIRDKPYAPEIIYQCPRNRYLISRYIYGTTWAEQAPSEAEYRQLDAIIQDYQQLPFSAPAIDYHDYLMHYYRGTSDLLSTEQRARWQAFQPALQQLRPGKYVPALCHHDLTPDNIIRSPQGLTLLDWEFARYGHPDIDRYSLQPQLCPNTAIKETLYWLDKLWQLNHEKLI